MVHVQHPTRLPVYTAPGQLLPERGSLAHQKGCARRRWGILPLQCNLISLASSCPTGTPAESRSGSWAAGNREGQSCSEIRQRSGQSNLPVSVFCANYFVNRRTKQSSKVQTAGVREAWPRKLDGVETKTEKELANLPPLDARWPWRQCEQAGEGIPCDVGINGLGILGRRLCREEMLAQGWRVGGNPVVQVRCL